MNTIRIEHDEHWAWVYLNRQTVAMPFTQALNELHRCGT
jgi:hypothetical protein